MTDTFVDEVREIRAAAKAAASKLLDIPGYGGRLAVRYGPADRDSPGVSAALRAWGSGEPMSKADELQLLVDCHQEILVRRNGARNADPEPYDDSGVPLRFDGGDERWQTLVGHQPETARQCAEALFMYAEHPTAGAGHVAALMPMLQGLEQELAARVEGESSGGPGSDEPS